MLPITWEGIGCHYEYFRPERSKDVTQADENTSYPYYIYEPGLKVNENQKETEGRVDMQLGSPGRLKILDEKMNSFDYDCIIVRY